MPRLYTLDFSGNMFTGEMTLWACNFTNVANILLTDNPLTPGPIPPCLCNIINLEKLQLAGTGRTGPLPACLFHGFYPPLTNLSVGRNALTGSILLSLCTAIELTYLELEQTGLTGTIPPCIGKLHNLTHCG